MLPFSIPPDVMGAAGALLVAVLTFLAAYLKKTESTVPPAPKKEDKEPVKVTIENSEEISEPLNKMATDIHDMLTIIKYTSMVRGDRPPPRDRE